VAGCSAGVDPGGEPSATTQQAVYAAWAPSVAYSIGARVTFLGTVYECIQAHRSQAGWEPPRTFALWKVIPSSLAWTVQAAYKVGDRSTYGGSTWSCIQAHTAQPGWEPPQVPALWTQVPAYTNRVDLVVLTDIASCLIGNPCSGGQCVEVYGPNGILRKSFAGDDAFRGVPPGSPEIAAAKQSYCIHAKMTSAQISAVHQSAQSYRDVVASRTGGTLNMDLRIHDVTTYTPTTMSHWGGVWMGPWDVQAVVEPFLSRSTDFVLVTNAMNDPVTGDTLPFWYCGGTFGSDLGLGGAGYTWVPQTSPGGGECATEEVYLHEWLHQVDWALDALSGFTDIYANGYPACGMGDPNPKRWFPSSDTCQSDPDYADCGLATCREPDGFYRHIFDAHWDRTRVLLGNYCRDGVQDYTETGVDVGGECH